MRFVKFLSLTFLIISVIFITYYVPHKWEDLFTNSESTDLTALIVLATAAIALIAWYQLNKSNKLTENEFLLHISSGWCSKEIIEARRILHRIFVSAYSKEKNSDNKSNETMYERVMLKVSTEVLNMKNSDNISGDEFISLLNLLDFMQTVSYICDREDLKIKEIYKLYGYNFIFLYQAFESFIKNRRKHQKKDYLVFSKLYQGLIKIKNSE